MDLLLKYFPGLTEGQLTRFREMEPLYRYWNERINVISRKDLDALHEKHILHSLALAKFMDFPAGCRILDVGTGGGFPGIPLAILYPEIHFTLIDSIGKKIKVVDEIAQSLGLTNVTALNGRAETLSDQYHFIVSRAVAAMPKLVEWVRPLLAKKPLGNQANGLIVLKGGDLDEELSGFGKMVEIIPISQWFTEEFFETKKIVYLKGEYLKRSFGLLK